MVEEQKKKGRDRSLTDDHTEADDVLFKCDFKLCNIVEGMRKSVDM